MSAQVKKRFSELTAYLGRDVDGLEKLKSLKDAVNVLRVSKAASDDAAARVLAAEKVMLDRVNAAEKSLLDARLENQRLTQLVTNLSNKIAELEKPVQEDEENDDTTERDTDIKSQIKPVVKAVRRQLRHCPPVSLFKQVSASPDIVSIERNAIADGWSHQSMWLLGASIALLVAFEGKILITTEETTDKLDIGQKEESATIRHFFRWITAANVNMDQTTERAGFVRLTGCAPLKPIQIQDPTNPRL